MILVVDAGGTVIPAATLVWGPGVHAEHRGNNVWHVSGLVAATEMSGLTRTVWVTKDYTSSKSVSRTGLRTHSVSATRERSPITGVTSFKTKTRTHLHGTDHIAKTNTKTQTAHLYTKTRTSSKTATVWHSVSGIEGTALATDDLTNWLTKTQTIATGTNWNTHWYTREYTRTHYVKDCTGCTETTCTIALCGGNVAILNGAWGIGDITDCIGWYLDGGGAFEITIECDPVWYDGDGTNKWVVRGRVWQDPVGWLYHCYWTKVAAGGCPGGVYTLDTAIYSDAGCGTCVVS